MPNKNCFDRTPRARARRPAAKRRSWRALIAIAGLLPVLLSFANPTAAANPNLGERLDGYYAREGNDASPAEAAGNNIYIKFFADRWIGMLFVPYPYAAGIEAERIQRAFDSARAQTGGAAYLRGRFDAFEQLATAQIERYGYLQDRIAFECGALSACTVRLGDGHLELIKPGVINPHIVRYVHVEAN